LPLLDIVVASFAFLSGVIERESKSKTGPR